MTKLFYISLILGFVIYFIVLTYIYLFQRNLLYHPSVNGYQGDETKFDYEEVFIQNSEGIKLKAWLHKKDLINKKTILFFHGNAGNLTNRNYKLNELSKLDLNFLIVSYRGFSNNEGKPSELGLYEDAKSAEPPKANITAFVCKGRKRPNVNQGISKFKAGQANCAAMITPTSMPTTPQTIVIIAN